MIHLLLKRCFSLERKEGVRKLQKEDHFTRKSKKLSLKPNFVEDFGDTKGNEKRKKNYQGYEDQR